MVARALSAVLSAMVVNPTTVHGAFRRLLVYLHHNAARAKPKRDRRTGRNKLGLHHVYATA